MFINLKNIFYFIKRHIKVLALTLFLTVLFFSLRFPWNRFLEKQVRDFQKKSPYFLQTDFSKLHLNILPPGVEFTDFSLNYKRQNIFLDSLKLSIIPSQWLAFKRAWRLRAIRDNSLLFVDFWKKENKANEEARREPAAIYFIKGYSPSFQLQTLNSFLNTKVSGLVKAQFDYKGSFNQIQNAKAFFNLTGDNIHLSQTEIPTVLGPLNFPSIKWKSGEMTLRLKEEEIVFKTFRLGAPSDYFIVQVKGSVSVFSSYGRVRFNSYNIQLQIDVDKRLQIRLLDLMFKSFKEDKTTFYRYRLRLTGRGNQVPKMETLSEF